VICDLLIETSDHALLDTADYQDMYTVKYYGFGLQQARRYIIAMPRVEGLNTTTSMANLLVWASTLTRLAAMG